MLPRICACSMTHFASQTKKHWDLAKSKHNMAAFYELQRQLKMERTAQSGTTTGAKMAVNRSRTFHFMLPAVYGACMENVTRKAAGKLSKGNHVRQSVKY